MGSTCCRCPPQCQTSLCGPDEAPHRLSLRDEPRCDTAIAETENRVPPHVPATASGSNMELHWPATVPGSGLEIAIDAFDASRKFDLPYIPNRVPTVDGVQHFHPETVAQMLMEGQCLLVDVRGEDRAAGLIEGAIHEPAIDQVPFLARVPSLVRRWQEHRVVVFTCQYSAHRAPQCANWYREQAPATQLVAILAGGFRGWEALGLPVLLHGFATDLHAAAANAKAMELGQQFVGAACADGRPHATSCPAAWRPAEAAQRPGAAYPMLLGARCTSKC